jgi:ubiquinone/menaquinone biosynthesis C-methylase UbiE
VNGAFRVFGGNLNDLVLEQGQRAVDLAEGKPILDMPVGIGNFAIEMAAAHSGIVVGCDIAQGMVTQTKLLAREGGIENLLPIRADAHHLPFADNSYAVVVSSNGLQVIPGPEKAVAEMARVLRPGGHMFVSIVSLPVAGLLPHAWRSGLPVLLSAGDDIARMMDENGIAVTSFERERLATLVEGVRR